MQKMKVWTKKDEGLLDIENYVIVISANKEEWHLSLEEAEALYYKLETAIETAKQDKM